MYGKDFNGSMDNSVNPYKKEISIDDLSVKFTEYCQSLYDHKYYSFIDDFLTHRVFSTHIHK